MGELTRAQIRQEALMSTGQTVESLGVDSSSSDGEARANLFVDWAVRHVTMPSVYRHRALQHEWSQALAAGQQAYPTEPPSSSTPTWAVHAVRIIDPTNPSDFDRLDSIRDREQWEVADVPAGTPTEYAIWGPPNELYLVPPPNADAASKYQLHIRRFRRHPRLDADTAKTIIEPEFDEIIVERTRWAIYRYKNDTERAEFAKSETGQLINEQTDRINFEAGDRDTGPNIDVRPNL